MEFYNFSCKYKKLVELANCKVIINNNEILLEDTDWAEIEYTFEVTANTIVAKFKVILIIRVGSRCIIHSG